MEIFVVMRMVPDLIYKLDIEVDKKSLNKKSLKFIPSDLDDNAIEQALILKEKFQGKITLFTFDAPDIDKNLYVYIAKGVDRIIKISKGEDVKNTEELARKFSAKIKENAFNVLLLGVSATDELDGDFSSFLASDLNLPYLGVVTGISLDNSLKSALVKKAFAGGLCGEFEVQLPAVIGIQSSEKPPRYVNLMKVRQVRKTSTIEEEQLPKIDTIPKLEILEMTPPPIKTKAKIIAGTEEEVICKICDVLQNEGVF